MDALQNYAGLSPAIRSFSGTSFSFSRNAFSWYTCSAILCMLPASTVFEFSFHLLTPDLLIQFLLAFRLQSRHQMLQPTATFRNSSVAARQAYAGLARLLSLASFVRALQGLVCFPVSLELAQLNWTRATLRSHTAHDPSSSDLSICSLGQVAVSCSLACLAIVIQHSTVEAKALPPSSGRPQYAPITPGMCALVRTLSPSSLNCGPSSAAVSACPSGPRR